MKRSQLIGLLISIAILVGMHFVPITPLLTFEGRNTLGILAVVLVLLITEPWPMGVTCILSIALLVIFKSVPNIPTALTGYTNPIVFFVLASFGISTAITKVPLSRRLLKFLMMKYGKNIEKMLFAFMLCSAVISSVISNVASTAVFIPIIINFLKIYEDKKDRLKTGKAFMIGLPVASMIGGMATPAGSSLNLMTIGVLEELTNTTITFVQWMFCGIPIVIIILPLAWQIIVRVYRPVEINSRQIHNYVNQIIVPSKMDGKEKYVLTLFISMFILWILGSWFPALNITLVTIVAFTLLFIPNYSILSWEEYLNSVSWPAFFLVASVISIGSALVTNGVSDWLVAVAFPSTLNLPVFGITFIVGIMVFLMLIPVPVAPALIPILGAPLVGLATNTGVSPVLTVMTLGLCVANCFLFPIDTVPVLTYMTGYYKINEMPKSTAIIQVLIAIVVAFWLPIALRILGFL
ncbi:sodium:sulfate symporter [Alkalibaculum sp. M08DMB]|uniref:Sodium-dependent dicarboxylate transporter SdcS n=1 Tax=Alkalibaculum sporogenes TaxID=2655001 RepID=A0A6A7K9T7_9FIRM|nr:SLC13 family permease [Alkalibaculum sporogenes]MPW26156.1 sodium:sulfate symporter [Alkalibaculum sporogenes]